MDVGRSPSRVRTELGQGLPSRRGVEASGPPVVLTDRATAGWPTGDRAAWTWSGTSVGLPAALPVPVAGSGVDAAWWAVPVVALGLGSTAASPRLARISGSSPRGTDAVRADGWGPRLDHIPLELVAQEGDLLGQLGRGVWGVPYELVKRSVDVGFAVVLGLLALPLLLLVAFAVALESPGGPLYSQIRVGLNGRLFRIYKLRSMRQDAERQGAVFAEDNDPRVTRLGRFLRLTRIDELPQLWNVLRGEMSIVGPRPERPEFTATLERAVPHYAKRYATKPGLTGWAQIRYRYTSTIEDAARKLEYDLYYLKHASVSLDLRILAATVRVVLGLRGR